MKNLKIITIVSSTTGVALMAVLGFIFLKLYKDNQACFEKRLLASTEALGMFDSPLSKKVGFQLVKGPVIKRESSSQENELAKINSKTNPAISYAVLFENKKPVCVTDVVGRPELVPKFMEVKDQKATKISGINLPPCEDFQLSVLKAKAHHALLINGDEPVQVASPVLFPALVLCLFGSASGVGIKMTESGVEKGGWLSGEAAAGVFVSSGLGYATGMILKEGGFAFSRFMGLSIAGLCGIGTYYAVGYFMDR